MLTLVIIPNLLSLSNSVKDRQTTQQKEEEKYITRSKVIEDARKQLLLQQAQTIANQERLKEITEKNLRLSEELAKRLAKYKE